MKPSVKAQFFSNLADALGAGMAPVQAFDLLSDSRDYGDVAARTKAGVFAGKSLTEAMRPERDFTEFDLALIEAGERGGTLDQQCRRLAARYDDLAHVAFSTGMRMGYPIMVLLSMFIAIRLVMALTPPDAPVVRDAALLMRDLAAGFVCVVVAVVASYYAFRLQPWYQKILLKLPGPPGDFFRLRTYGTLTSNIRLLFGAGYTIGQAIESGARGTGMDLLAADAAPVVNQLKKGQSIASCAPLFRDFPTAVVTALKMGEAGGTIDGSLLRVEQNYFRDLKVAVEALPGFLAKAAFAAVFAISLVFIIKIVTLIVQFYSLPDQLGI